MGHSNSLNDALLRPYGISRFKLVEVGHVVHCIELVMALLAAVARHSSHRAAVLLSLTVTRSRSRTDPTGDCPYC